MALASNARIGWQNLADLGAVTASSFSQLTPPALLQNPHVARKWRTEATSSASVTIDLLAQRSVDCVALMGLNLGAAGTTRIRLSTGDSSAVDGDAHDSDPSGASAGRVNERYPALIYLLPSAVTARYIRIDLAQSGNAYIEAGRAFAGIAHQFDYNFTYGWGRTWADGSRLTESRGGQDYIDRGPRRRQVDITFDYLTTAQRNGVVEDIDQFNGRHTDVLLILDPTSTERGRDSIWGLMDDMTPVSQPFHQTFAKTYRIKERL